MRPRPTWTRARSPPQRDRVRGRFDLRGALLSALGAASLVYGLSQAAERPWTDALVAGPLLAGLLLSAFVATQRRAAEPIVRLGLFRDRDRDRALAFASMLVLPGALIGAYFFLSQSFQQHHGWSPLEAAFGLLPVPVTMAATAGVAVRVERAIGPRATTAIGTAALVVENLWLSALGPDGAYPTGAGAALLTALSPRARCRPRA
ncbi:hypothetical protein [Streptomyces sp. NPDC056387]|uniref:hypothetical protein n=1 Tax=Streptomyces sp. NPDC056387 TaxID=3345803 RepID=UPI0035DBBCCF